MLHLWNTFICCKLSQIIFVDRLKAEILIVDISVHQFFMFLALCLQLKWRGKVHSVVEGKVSLFLEFIHRNASSKFPGKKREGGEEVSNNCFVYQFKMNSDIYA